MNRSRDYFEMTERLAAGIESKRETVCRLRDLAGRCTSVPEAVPGGGNPVRRPMADIIDRIADIEKEIEKAGETVVSRRAKEIEAISCLEDGRERAVLTLRYIDGLNMYDTAGELDISPPTAYRLRASAFSKLKI